MKLMRNNLSPLMPNICDAHAGLLTQRGLQKWEDGEKETEKKLVETIASVKANELYFLAFQRWLITTYNSTKVENGNPNFATIGASINGRLYTGLATGGALETGASTHHTYGMPMLTGSAVKGAVRTYTEQLFAQRDDDGKIIFEQDPNDKKIKRIKIADSEKQKLLDILFGKVAENDSETDDAGYIIWHDAWWIPPVNNDGTLSTGGANRPFVEEVVTVHQQKYYGGELDQALDMENPIPNQQIAIQGGFYFTIQGDEKWVNFAKELLVATLENQGMGAKTSSGYGYFTINEDDEINQKLDRLYQSLTVETDSNDEFAKIRSAIMLMNKKNLIDSLSKDKNKFFTEYNIDKDNIEHLQAVATIVNEYHANIIESLQDSNNKNEKKAYKFVQDNL